MSVRKRQEELLTYLENNIDMIVGEQIENMIDGIVEDLDPSNPLYQQVLELIRTHRFILSNYDEKYLHAIKKMRQSIFSDSI